jgi:hypothetical protein
MQQVESSALIGGTRPMATKPDARQAAEAAMAFGQDDDFTVLT